MRAACSSENPSTETQERLARLGRYLAEIAFRREVASHRIGGAINSKRIPDRRKQPKQGNSQQVLRILSPAA
jgi:hypothetical protein